MNKITTYHLARAAYVYIRQSTADQLVNNPESRRRQYALTSASARSKYRESPHIVRTHSEMHLIQRTGWLRA
jgi:hypothetical protein